MRQNYSDILKKTLLHYIDLEYCANGINDDVLILWEELGDECSELISAQNGISSKDAYALVYRMIKEKVESFGTELEERLKEEANAVSSKETEFLSGLYGASLSVGAVSLSKILFTPIDGRDTLQSFVDRSKKNILRSYDTALRSGYMFGQSSDSINEQTLRNLKQPINGMSSGIKTAIPSFAKQTDRIVFLQNNLEVTWVSTLDGRQCLLCTSLNGTTYKNPSLVPTYPAHSNCRCVIIPSKEIGDKIPTYEEYIESLSDEEQYHVLGKNRYELYKNNQLTLRQFINNGRVLRLDELDLPKNLSLKITGARSEIVNKILKNDVYDNEKLAEKYYQKIRDGDNQDFITRIANNSKKSYNDVEQIVKHIFIENHHFTDGSVRRFEPDTNIIAALERLKTNEYTDKDILLLNHELLELTYMKNKKYNVYEIAHEMANLKYDWSEALNENVQKSN